MRFQQYQLLTPIEQGALDALRDLKYNERSLIHVIADTVRTAETAEDFRSMVRDLASQGRDNEKMMERELGKGTWQSVRAVIECHECPEGVCYHLATG